MPKKVPQTLYLPAPKLNQFHIMQQIALDPHVTQAELGQHCSLSVAMVNNYMKELCASGLIEYQRKSSKTVSYHLTPAGREAAEATRHELIQELVTLFVDAKARIRQFVLSQAGGELRKVVLYGSNDLAELVFHALDEADVNIVGVCDDAPAKVGRDWCGREILNPSQIRFIEPDAVVIAESGRAGEIYGGLSYLQGRGIRVVRLAAVDVNPLPHVARMAVPEQDDHSLPPKQKAV